MKGGRPSLKLGLGLLDDKSFILSSNIDGAGSQGRVFDIQRRHCGCDVYTNLSVAILAQDLQRLTPFVFDLLLLASSFASAMASPVVTELISKQVAFEQTKQLHLSRWTGKTSWC
jgi:hypothetical protein